MTEEKTQNVSIPFSIFYKVRKAENISCCHEKDFLSTSTQGRETKVKKKIFHDILEKQQKMCP